MIALDESNDLDEGAILIGCCCVETISSILKRSLRVRRRVYAGDVSPARRTILGLECLGDHCPSHDCVLSCWIRSMISFT